MARPKVYNKEKDRRPKSVPLPVKFDYTQYPQNNIADALLPLAVDIRLLMLDPMNAREHPEESIEDIKQSLCLYSQTKPIVVQKSKMLVVAGNGTITAARELGWTLIAANVMDLTDVEAAGYGLADNRSAESSRWNYQIVKLLDDLLLESGQPNIGWSAAQLAVLRQSRWTPPKVSDAGVDEEKVTITFRLNTEQKVLFDRVTQMLERRFTSNGNPKPSPAKVFEVICDEWLDNEGGCQ